MDEPNPVTGKQVAQLVGGGDTYVDQLVKPVARVASVGVNESGDGYELDSQDITELINTITVWLE